LRKHGFPLLHCGKCRGFYGMWHVFNIRECS
jgi:hypothetical protein